MTSLIFLTFNASLYVDQSNIQNSWWQRIHSFLIASIWMSIEAFLHDLPSIRLTRQTFDSKMSSLKNHFLRRPLIQIAPLKMGKSNCNCLRYFFTRKQVFCTFIFFVLLQYFNWRDHYHVLVFMLFMHSLLMRSYFC